MMNNSSVESAKIPRWKTRKAVIASVLFLLFLVCLATYLHGCQRVDARKLDGLMRQSLPVGTDKGAVLTFLDSKHIRHSEYMKEYRRIDANIPKSTVGWINGQIYIVFTFDQGGKLVHYELRELFETL